MSMLLWTMVALAQKFDVDGIKYNVTSTEDLTVEVTRAGSRNSGEITIPASVQYDEKIYSVTSIGNFAFLNCGDLTSVTIGNSVTSIGDYAFWECSGLSSVTIGNSVTSIGGGAFSGCSGLTSVTIPNSVTSIGGGAFSGCSGLTSVTIPNSVTSIGDYAFYGCSGLTSVSIPNGVTSIGSEAFYCCSGLTSVTIPNSVTSIGSEAFYCCSGLSSVTIPNSVTSIGTWAFKNCSGLTSVTLHCAEVGSWFSGLTSIKEIIMEESVTSIGGYAFNGCSGLTSVTIPNSVTSIGGFAFSGCSGLTSVTIGNGVTSIGGDAFRNCSGLTSVTIGNSVTSIGTRAFFNCCDLTSVTIPNSVTSIGNWAFSGTAWYNNQPDGLVYAGKVAYIYKGEKPTNTNIVLDEGTLGIADFAFDYCSGLTSVTIPNSMTTIGDYAFYNCSGLTSVTIPNSVTSIGNNAFSRCSGLTSIVVEKGNAVYDSRNNCNAIIKTENNELLWGCMNTIIPNSVTSIGGGAFSGCSGLTSVTIPNSVTSIGGGAFSDCSGLTSVSIGSGVISIGGYAFNGCSGLTSVTIPNSVISIGGYAFNGCSGLTSIVVEDGNAVYDSRNNCNAIIKTEDNELIAGCQNTIIPNSVTSIGGGAFSGCSGLTSVTIPNSVTSIGDDAFMGCSGLTSVTIPNSVTSIGSHPFNGCSGLTEVLLMIKEPFAIVSGWRYVDTDNIPLYVPKGTKALYEATEGWNVFKNIIEKNEGFFLDNAVYINDTITRRDAKMMLSLKMKSKARIRGFQFDLYLPEGVTVAKSDKGKILGTLSKGRLADDDEHTLTLSEQPDGAIRFLCGSQYDETFTGNDGEIATLTLNIADDMEEGDYDIVLRNMKLSETDIEKYYETEELKSTLSVAPCVIGDINSDQQVDVSDYIGIANHILGNTPTGFVGMAADVNNDTEIDVSDYIGVANIILTGSIYGNSNNSRGMMRRASADDMENALYISPFTTENNTQKTLSIKMKNSAAIRGFQFDLYLPDGVTVAKSTKGKILGTLTADRLPEEDEHTLTMSEQADGSIRFLCGSQYDETFTGTDGEIATLKVNIADNVSAGNYPILLKNMKLTETDITKFYETKKLETTMRVVASSDTRTIIYETATEAPEMANNVNVRVIRTLNADEWSTICLPFAMTEAQVKAAFGNDVKIGDFTGCEVNGDKLTANFDDVQAIAANHPYIIKVSSAITEFTADGVDICPDEAKVKRDGNGSKYNTFVGNYENGKTLGDGCLFLSNGDFYFSNGSTRIKGLRAYFDLDAAGANSTDASRVTISFDETTRIDRMSDVRCKMSDAWYDLNGRKLNHSPKAKGIYVKNGKKMVIK